MTLAFGANVDAANIKKKLIEISKEFCEILDDNNEHFAEFGLDFAIDCDLNYWFIEANVRPTFNGFKKMDKKKLPPYLLSTNSVCYGIKWL
ncbi:MAG: YheC/YheD family protein [Bacillaceae bacterium]|nr:YheC/YheD family protein [Bacillaceae bacterium]